MKKCRKADDFFLKGLFMAGNRINAITKTTTETHCTIGILWRLSISRI